MAGVCLQSGSQVGAARVAANPDIARLRRRITEWLRQRVFFQWTRTAAAPDHVAHADATARASGPVEKTEETSLSTKVPLKIAIADHPHTVAIKNGSIKIEGVEPEFISVKPQIGAFRRMVRDVEFDVCELAPTTYIIARAYHAPFVALPIFVTRRFHHGGMLVRPDAGIKTPKDLEGKQVGVRAYSVTTGVWNRQVLIDEYGLDASKVTWVVDDEEHVLQMTLPSNVIHAPQGSSLADMMAKGELVAGVEGAAGIGRTGAPTGGWQEVEADYPDLLPDATAREAEYYARTGVYPMHGTIVVKDSVLAAHPWIAKSLYDAFEQAKNEWLARLDAGEATSAGDKKYLELRKIVGNDPLPYGLSANIKTIETLEATAFKQGLTPRRMAVAELFVDPSTAPQV
jgi:4,5-dihydroxyphthalate decarboxylase